MEEKQRQANKKLRRERELRGWSQRALAEMVGTSEQVFNRWEAGQHKPNRYFQTQLCQLFGKNAEELGFMDEIQGLQAGEVSQLEADLTEQGFQPQVPHSSHHAPTSDTISFDTILLSNQQNLVPSPSLEWWERLVHPAHAKVKEEVFLYFQQLLETGWGLSNAGELLIAEQVLMSFLPGMLQLAPYRREAASLAAEGMRLRGILAAHQQRMHDKLTICLQAVEYARQANNFNILIAQLTELAVAFIYARQPANSFKTYQEALSYCHRKEISPLVRSRIYAAAAPTFAKHGEVKASRSFIENAYESFPTRLEGEPAAFSADNRLFMIDYYHGLLSLVLNQPVEAYSTFEQAVTSHADHAIPERWRLIILNYQGLASILSHQLEAYAGCLEEGLSGSLTLGSKKRYDEAVCIFQQHVPKGWKDEPRLKQIAEQFQLGKESRKAEELEI